MAGTTRHGGVPAALAAMPLRTVKAHHAGQVYARPRPQLARLEHRGLLHRIARGYYIVVPQEHVGSDWMPTLEAVAAGIAAADYGSRAAPLMATSAARLHGAIPRALTTAMVAAPVQRKPIRLIDRDAVVQFVTRDTGRLDVEAATTDLGKALITTPEQTVLDLGRRPALDGFPDQARDAIRTLLPRCNSAVLDELAAAQQLRSALRRVRRWEA